jgi:hypothetical protein
MANGEATADDGGRWMTYAEIATLRRITRASAERLVQRRRWRRQADNRGHVRVYVPGEWCEPPPLAVQPDIRHDVPQDITQIVAPIVAPLQAAVAALQQQLEHATRQADRAENRAEQAENRALLAESGRDAERSRADALRERLADLTAKLSAAQAELAAAEEDAAEAIRRPQAEELHFKTGFLGGLARCVVHLRAAGDPFEQTVLLPPLILLVFVWLTATGKVGLWVTYPALLLPPSIAGLWLGFVLGSNGLMRILFRGMLVGAIGGCAYVAVANETLDKQHALLAVFNMVLINSLCFFFWGLMSATVADFASTSEAKWQALKPRRDYVAKVLRISLFMEKLEGQELAVALGVLFCRGVLPILVTMWISYVFFQVSPGQFIHGLVIKSVPPT